MSSFISLLKNDFKINKRLNQRVFIFVLRGNTFDWNGYFFSFFPKLLFKVLNFFILSLLFNSDIPASVKIGSGPRFPHPYNLIIQKNTIIGNDVVIFHNVTIGTDEKNFIDTVIGNNVFIGCNVVILSVGFISDNVKIGAGATILKNIYNSGTYVGIFK